MICTHRLSRQWAENNGTCPTCKAPVTWCPRCDGFGLTSESNYDTCPACGGSGVVAGLSQEKGNDRG